MPVWVSLLRAVNLGARNQVSMPRLREVLPAAGFAEVRTHLQSGNVITRSSHRSPEVVARAVRDCVRQHFGFDVPVLVRSPAQLVDVLAWCPFPIEAADRPTAVHVLHLAGEPEPARVEALLDEALGPDAVAVRGCEAVVRYGDGSGAGRFSNDRVLARLGVEGTARNWRTLSALVALTS